MIVLLLMLISLTIFLFYCFINFLVRRRKYYALRWKLPVHDGHPILGIMRDFCNREGFIPFCKLLEKRYGSPFIFYVGLFPIMYVADPHSMEKVLTSPACVNKPRIYKPFKDVIGGGLIVSSNPEWSYHRKLLNSGFTHRNLVSFLPIFNKEVNIFNTIISDYVGKGELKIVIPLLKLTLDTAYQTTMGRQMNFQLNKNKDIIHAFEELLKIVRERTFSPLLHYDVFYKSSPFYKEQNRLKELLTEFTLKIINENLNEMVENPKSVELNEDNINITKKNGTLIEILCKLFRSNILDSQKTLQEAISVTSGAFETTANTLHSIFVCLATHPDCQEKLFEEIFSIFPEKDFDVTYEDTKEMIYTEMVINETLRLFPAIPQVARKPSEDLDFENDVIIPKGMNIILDLINLHRNEKYWGSDAESFDPERFSKENSEGRHPYAFIPFTKGIRNCIGWRYGILSLKTTLAKVLRKYRFTTNFKFQDLVLMNGIVLNFKEHPNFVIHRREI